MSRQFALYGLFLSLLLHTGLLLLPGEKTVPATLTRIKVQLQPSVNPSSQLQKAQRPRTTVTATASAPPSPAPPPKQREAVNQPPPKPATTAKAAPAPVREQTAKQVERPVTRQTLILEPNVTAPEPAAPLTEANAGRAIDDDHRSKESSPPRNLPLPGSMQITLPKVATPVEYLRTPRSYPPLAKRRGWEGTVRLKVSIGIEGLVTKAELLQTSGFPILDRSALQMVRKWHFKPATQDGAPVETAIELPIVYELK